MQQLSLLDYLEWLWSRGFRLAEEDVQFIFFGKSLANANDVRVKLAIESTLQLKFKFDGSFYIGILELFNEHEVMNKKDAIKLLKLKNMY